MERLPGQIFTEDNVTYHAVLRYLQRVMGVTVPADEATIGSKAAAQLHGDAVGLNIGQVKALILSPAICTGLALGARAVRTWRFTAVLNPAQHMVVTIQTLRHTPGFIVPKRYSEPSRNETRRLSHQFTRRGRDKHKRHQPHE